ncbi:hypothetical protein CDD81_5310 [Ophiocordyceps australis]|uniref:Uncharacterized protein n=1 Tax=Ophiocordyceps australis TaxID=1399860 RepID=A0A2C5XMF4_9HYPO|nr:hypothetical protein CDD81_5310 [Ophiocordyceps australis]
MDVESLFSVKDKAVLVTGGGKGIGLMIAQGFVSAGARVYITGREAGALASAASALSSSSSSGGNSNSNSNSSNSSSGIVVPLPANLQNYAECVALVKQLAALEPGGLHVLVNNAGAAWGATVDEYPDAAWTKLLTLNLQRVFTLTQLCLPLLERAAVAAPEGDGSFTDPARVIHIGSIDGIRVPVVANYAYAASKAGLHHLSRTLARDLGPRGITSNVVAPGPFATKMMRATLDAVGQQIRAEAPLRRIGNPHDVAGTCLYLASRAGAYCNGALIRLDGGISLASRM